MSDRRPSLSSAVGPVVGAASAWLGAASVCPPGPLVAVAVGAVAVRARTGRGAVVAGCLLLAALTSVQASRSLAGLDDVETGDIAGVATLITDPAISAGGRVQAEVRLHGRRYWATAASGAAGRALRSGLAGERFAVTGSVSDPGASNDWRRSRHLVADLRIERAGRVDGGAWPHRLANALRRLLERGAGVLPPGRRSLLSGLVLGDDRAQPARLGADFRGAGLTHLLAVSGQNLAFVLVVVGPVLRRFRLWPRFLAAVVAIAGFALVTRFEPSVLRAGAMLSVALWWRLAGRASVGIGALAAAVTGLLVVDPLLVHAVGFRLSVAASVGVLAVAPRLQTGLARLPGPRWVGVGLAVTTGAQLAVAPVLVPAFGPMPLAAIPANIVAGPIAGVLMTWGLTAGTVAGLGAGVGGGALARVLHTPTAVGLWALEATARVGAWLPLGAVGLTGVAVAGVGLVVLTAEHRRPMTVAVGAALVGTTALATAMTAVSPGSEPAGWRATVWSNGPVAVAELRPGTDATEVLATLSRRQVRRLSVLVVTSTRPELAGAVAAIRSRHPEADVLAPSGSNIADATTPEPGARLFVAGIVIAIDDVVPTLEVRIGWGSIASEGAIGAHHHPPESAYAVARHRRTRPCPRPH